MPVAGKWDELLAASSLAEGEGATVSSEVLNRGLEFRRNSAEEGAGQERGVGHGGEEMEEVGEREEGDWKLLQ